MKRYLEMNFNDKITIFTDSLLETNRSFGFYVDWLKPQKVIKKYNKELNILNGLIKSKNFDDEFRKMLNEHPNVVNVFPLLFALSKSEVEGLNVKGKSLKVVNEDILGKELLEYQFGINGEKELNEKEVEKYLDFVEKIGIKHLFINLLGTSIIDYLIGCEVGLDSNARKNRSGKVFEKALEPIIKEIAKNSNIEVLIQKKFSVLRKRGFDISSDISERKADFILIKDKKIMNIEANFYNGAGSKPEEIIDSYINRQDDLRENGIEFILITDGKNCWGDTDKSQLKKGFRHLDYLLNFNMAKKGMLKEIVECYF